MNSYALPVHYLSEEWIAAADDAVRATSSTAPNEPVVIDQIVHDAVSYRVTIARDAASVILIDPTQPSVGADARFSQNATTAADVAQGNTDAHQAFLLGRIRFEGDVNVLIERGDAFTWLQETLAPLVAATTF